jgi:hypothetical protein
VPQLALREEPQLSVAVSTPQFACSREQKVASDSGEQLHTLLVLQTWPVAQGPHDVVVVRLIPQLSMPVKVPQVLPSRLHMARSVSLLQQTLGA